MSGTLGVRVVVTGDVEEHGVCLAVERQPVKSLNGNGHI